MDDDLEQPTAVATESQSYTRLDTGIGVEVRIDKGHQDEADAEGEAEDGGLDWTKLLPASARPIIPKRGEKEFEPRFSSLHHSTSDVPAPTGQGSSLQQQILHLSRTAMFDAIRAPRTISSKLVSYGMWYPELGRTHVTVSRGVHFATMGHSAPRPVQNDMITAAAEGTKTAPDSASEKLQKRLELLPEETIYLVERGSMLCYKSPSVTNATPPLTSIYLGNIPGAPMSVQQVYTECISRSGLTLEKYQVYAYLKRLGYTVTRAEAPDPYYHLPTPYKPTSTIVESPSPSEQAPPSLLWRLTHHLHHLLSKLLSILPSFHLLPPRLSPSPTFDWWHPLPTHPHPPQSYASIFAALRNIIPSGHKVPLHTPPSQKTDNTPATTPYRIFYNVYKPNTPFRKTTPGKPDFQVVVVNARTTPMPTLYELTDLFDQVPEVPPPAPRKRGMTTAASSTNKSLGQGQGQQQKENKEGTAKSSSAPVAQQEQTRSVSENTRLWLSWLRWPFSFLFSSPTSTQTGQKNPKPNPFPVLKMGKKIIIIAAVDSGNISFFRFGQGSFEEWPMI
ncbi:hypothetical protein AMATHDRAFT_88815 [Amanita thiersii Skay4041]|uniref:tRNA-splicing endonuclease subunit Sen54 N-terminal domain-containing protein n=1 Tax=Amanita thiersii Skay4041 TaxID=703135 RepID=A0A2A9N6B3_9AGAR|nr:hypothetical protein AMATHDRAFT_88815 [Amanita thiersii Skay4041]